MEQIRQLSLYLSPSSALCKQLHSRAMRLFTRLEYEHKSCASYLIYSVHAPYVILENHCHLVVQSKSLGHDISRLKSYTAKQLIIYLHDNNVKQILDQLAFYKKAHKTDRAYQFWQEGIHPEWIQNDEMMQQKIDYIHNNPVKRGYVDKAIHWRYSSARNYMGQDGLLEICASW